MKKATVKFDRADFEHRHAIQRAAGPMKPKTAYSRKDKSWKRDY